MSVFIPCFKQIQESIYTYHHMKNITPVIIVDEAILVLAGQTPFITQLSRQAHEALRQRIIINYCLHGLTKDETKEYVKSRLDKAGCFVFKVQ
jgi:CDP-diacylglycerol pyrophosphatase